MQKNRCAWLYGLEIIVLLAVMALCLYLEFQQPHLDTVHLPAPEAFDPLIRRWAALFEPSVFSMKERCAELAWFHRTAQPLRGLEIRSVGEDIETCFWESQYLARAFKEVTGIEVRHDVIGEGNVVTRLMEQTEKGQLHYDIYVTDADMIGTHLRSGKIVILSDYMADEGLPYTNPYLDLDDFMNLECGQDYEGRQLQLPDYHFLLVYWFRHDWFSDPAIRREFRETYGYELGVPLNWSAYEDIAAFFDGRQMKNPNDSEVVAYGHADYGLPGPWLGWRFSDAFLAIAGMGDKGLPNGLPVDEWGIRVRDKVPVGASVKRGGSINGPAAVYGLTTWLDMLNAYAPPESKRIDWLGLGPIAARGDIAQTWYWSQIYATLNPEYNKEGSPVCDKHGQPVWRIAPIPHGKYWEPGMKMGYMDAGSWTIPLSTEGPRRHAAWLWAQFCLSKTVALKKFLISATPARKSTLHSAVVTKEAARFGGMVELMRSPIIKQFTDSGPNVPHYPAMSTLWWQHIARAIQGECTPQQAMDNLAEQFDTLMQELTTETYTPVLNPPQTRQYWLDQPGAPKPPITERQPPQTCRYEKLLKQWRKAESQ